MNAQHLKSVLTAAINARKPILIKGAPGVGKSDIVAQAASDAGAELVISHPVVSDPTDFKGLPGIVNGMAEFLPFGELRKAIEATSPMVFFLDDLGQAPPAVQAAAMQLLLARQINGHKVSDFVTFIAATNRREDKAGVSGMLEPVKSRFASIVELTPDVESWIEWALNVGNMPIELVAFIKFRPQLLHDFKASADLNNSPCPRTVANVGALMQMGLPREVEFEVFTGAVGEGFAAELMAFLGIFRKLPNIDHILLNPDTVAVPTDPSVLYALAGALARKATDNNFERIVKFGERMPPEFTTLMIRDVVKRSPAVCNTKAFIQWASKNAEVIL